MDRRELVQADGGVRLAPQARRTCRGSGAIVRAEHGVALVLLLGLLFSKYIYLASFGSYYTFYLIHRFHLSVRSAQLHLFIFLGAVAAGTIFGGPIGDRIGQATGHSLVDPGRAAVLARAALCRPVLDAVLSVIIGFILASAFSAIIVYAQELLPGRVGLIAGLFFGFAFGIAGIGAAALGELADRTSIGSSITCARSFLPSAFSLLVA